MALRGKDIECVGGECYAHVFENPKAGIQRGLFWNFFLECAPIAWGGEEWEPAILCDWVKGSSRNWRSLAETNLENLPRHDLMEASFYLSAHHHLDLNRLEMVYARENLIRVHVTGTFDLEGYDELDGHGIQLDTIGVVSFKGLIVMPENLSPKPPDESAAVAVAQEFMDLENFSKPLWDGSRFLFEPRCNAV